MRFSRKDGTGYISTRGLFRGIIRRAENRLARQLLKLHAKLIHFIPDNIRFLSLQIKDAFDGRIEVTEIRFEIEFIGE